MQTRKFNLQQYGILASGLLGSFPAVGQTEYHEFDPYFPMTFNEDVTIDVDLDGIDDFQFHFRKEWSASTGYGVNDYSFYMDQFGDNQVVVKNLNAEYTWTTYYDYCNLPAALGVDQIGGMIAIDASDEWGQADIMMRADQCSEYAYVEQGWWPFTGGQKDKIIGFRLSKPEYYYGWMRIRHNDNGQIDFVKDVVISTVPDSGVITPNLVSSYAPGPDAIELYYSGAALMVNFNGVPDETLIQDYRVILRNAIYTSELLAEDCDITKEENFIRVEKSGAATYTADISSLTKYWTDVPIADGEMMRAYVYTKFNFPYNLFNGLSPESNQIESTAPTVGIQFIDEAANVQAWYGNGMITIQSSDNNPTSIQVVNMNGQVIYSDMQLVNMLGSNLQIQFSAPSGMYIAHVMNSAGVLGSAMFIVQ